MEHLNCEFNLNSRKRLLYIGHDFHGKTKSSDFLQDMLAVRYDMDVLSFDPDRSEQFVVPEHIKAVRYDVLVLFQVVPDLCKLRLEIQYDHAAFFPMYDNVGEKGDDFWEQFADFNVICFSRNLYIRLKSMGLSAFYIQYFPQPVKPHDYGDKSSVFFWYRVRELNTEIVETLLKKFEISRLHIHKSPDPGHDFIEPSDVLSPLVRYSTWYRTKDEMLAEIEKCGIYISPRPYEGIGMSFLEAMAMGRCVIAPDYPTMNEYIRHGYNGLLYDFQNVMPLKVLTPNDILKIQRNAYTFMKLGFQTWDKEKYKIFDWIEEPIEVEFQALTKSRKRYICLKTISLLGFVPFLTVKTRNCKKYYDLFDCIRLLKMKRSGHNVKYYLFGLAPVWFIK